MSEKRIWGSLDPFHETGAILGRKVANGEFLRFFLRADPFDGYHFFLPDQRSREGLDSYVADEFPSVAPRMRYFDRADLPGELSRRDYHCFHQSDAITAPAHLARVRNEYSRTIFPVTGVTHSLSYADYPQFFLKHLWPGATPRDCVVATSRTGAEVARRYFDGLRRGYGLDERDFPGPSVRRVPLGVDTGGLRPPTPQERATARAMISAGPDQAVILVFGRIQHHSKMDLLPLLRAMRRVFAAGVEKDSVRLILAGWTEPGDDFTPTLKDLAANIGLGLDIWSRPDEDQKLALFRASDVFVSIADNPQETFGLTVLEAGAMGLACVASDYDGYKDLVENGKTGLLVPTIGAEDTRDVDVMAPLLFDNHYHLLLAQRTVVRVPELAEALERLVANPGLRRDMGLAARRRVEEKFSWPGVIERYMDLWDELASLPVDPERVRGRTNPLHPDYADLFRGYTTATLEPGTMVKATVTGQAVYRGVDHVSIYQGVSSLVEPEVLNKLLFAARKPVATGQALDRLAGMLEGADRGRLEALVLWALKHDLLEAV